MRNFRIARVPDDLPVRSRLPEIARLFLKLGLTAFGGPAAHISMMEDEVVRRRQWLTEAEFLDLAGAVNLIPGPNSTELAIHIGHRRAGWPGLWVAGICFILPASLIVTALAWAYTRYGNLPELGGILLGVKPVILAVIFQALWRLGQTALKNWLLTMVGLGCGLLVFTGLNELVVLFGAGLSLILAALLSKPSRLASALCMAASPSVTASPAQVATAFSTNAAAAVTATTAALAAGKAFSLGALFLFFVKTGAVLFGSGYVLLAFLRADLVARWGWLTEAQLLDAIAVGQVTPGPVFTTATFIGYLLGGGAGAVVATVGIFLPAFFFVAISGPFIPRLRQSRLAGAFLDGVNAASLALMAVVTAQLTRSALVDWLTILLALISALLLLRFKVNSAWLVLGGAIVGYVASFVLRSSA